MANVTVGRNAPTPYDIRMDKLRTQMSPPSSNVGGIGGLFKKLGGPVLASLDVVNRLRKGENPADVASSTVGGLAGGAAGSVLGPFGTIGGYAAGSAALPPVIDWLGKNAVLSDRGAINKPKTSQMFGPAYGNVNVPSGGPRNFGPDYKNRELAAGQAAENYRTGAGFPGQSPAAERAYQSERSSVAQQAAQNPELQRYQDQAILARQALQGYDPASGPLPGAAQTAQDMGMAIWAKANPGLAAKVRPGQSGFGAIQNTLASSAATSGLQMPNQLMSTTQTPSPVPFPTAIPQSGLQIPNVFQEDQLSTYPEFDPKKVDIGLFSKFMQANPKK